VREAELQRFDSARASERLRRSRQLDARPSAAVAAHPDRAPRHRLVLHAKDLEDGLLAAIRAASRRAS